MGAAQIGGGDKVGRCGGLDCGRWKGEEFGRFAGRKGEVRCWSYADCRVWEVIIW